MKHHPRPLKTLGNQIRQRRLFLNLSQDELGLRSGLHRTFISDVERGTRNVSFTTLLALANGLGLTVSDLTTGVQSTPDEKPADHSTGQPDQQT